LQPLSLFVVLSLGAGAVFPTALYKRQYNHQHSCCNHSADCQRRVWTRCNGRQHPCCRLL